MEKTKKTVQRLPNSAWEWGHKGVCSSLGSNAVCLLSMHLCVNKNKRARITEK